MGTANLTFGTDGWRGVIADDFTFDNVRIVAQAVADYLLGQHVQRPVGVGHDTRFLSDRFARTAAETLAANGLAVRLSGDVIPSPCLSFAVKHHRLAAGVMVTASHNPPRFNGIKFKADYAGSAERDVTLQIEAAIGRNAPKHLAAEDASAANHLAVTDFIGPYLDGLRSFVRWDVLRGARWIVVADPMYGAQSRLLERLLADTGCTVITIHGSADPSFGGIYPEPIPPHTDELQRTVVQRGADLGLATDGDADRIGACSSKGDFISPHQILSMLLVHCYKNRGVRGKVVKTISTTTLVEKIAGTYGLPVIETPIGFKHICKLLRTDDILIGGEESGGNGFKGYIPERDGTLSGLLLLEMMSMEERRLDDIVAQLDREYGSFRFRRLDIDYPLDARQKLLDALKSRPLTDLLGSRVVEVRSYDGVKFIAADDNWLLIRPSGTEPVLRIYAEAKRFDDVDRLLALGQQLAEALLR